MRKLLSGLFLVTLSLVSLVACTSGQSASKPQQDIPKELVKVRVGSQVSGSEVGLFIAKEKGFFKEQGIEVENVRFASASEVIPALATGKIDVGGVGVNAATLNAVGREVGMRLVADKGSVPPGRGWIAFVVRKDLADQVKDYKDLKGRTIGVTPPLDATANSVDLDKALKKGGLTSADIKIVNLPFTDMIAALSNKGIDIAMLNEPFVSAAVEQGFGVRWKGADEIYPGHQISTIAYGSDFIKNQPDVANRFMVAYVKGVREYNTVYDKGLDKSEVLSILASYTNVKDPKSLERAAPTGLNPDGYVNFDSVAEDQEWFLAKGKIKEKVDLKVLIDNRYAEYAVQKLGKYKK